MVEVTRRAADAARDFAVEKWSTLLRHAPESEFATTRFAASNAEANEYSQYTVPKVLDKLPPPEQVRLGPYLIADRIEALRNQLQNQLTHAPDQAAAQALAQHIHDLSTIPDPHTGAPITRADLHSFFHKPEVMEAVTQHKRFVEPILEKNFVESGQDPTGVKGLNSGAFYPAYVVDDNGAVLHPTGGGAFTGGRQSPMASVGSTPGARQFTGRADTYLTQPQDGVSPYEASIGMRLRSGFRAANQRRMIGQWLKDGVAIPAVTQGAEGLVQNPALGQDAHGNLTMPYHGAHVLATTVDLAKKFDWNSPNLKSGNLTLPGRVVMPQHVWNSIKAIAEEYRPDELSNWFSQNVVGRIIRTTLLTIGEQVQHSAALTSRLAKLGKVSSNPYVEALSHISPQARTFYSLKNTIPGSLVHSDAERHTALTYAARQGVLPHNMGLSKGPLYSRNGILANALTTLWKGYREGLNHPDPAVRKRAMRNLNMAMRDMNVHMDIKQPAMQRLLRKIGSGTFYQTGMRNRLVGYHQGAGLGQKLALIAAGALGSQLLKRYLWKALDPEHRSPEEVPGYVDGAVPVGTDADGRTITMNINLLDRTQGLMDAIPGSVTSSIADQDTWQRGVINAGLAGVNQAIEPPGSGPFAGVAQAMLGRALHLSLDDNGRLDLTPTKSSSLPLFSAGRLLNAAQPLLPQSYLVGDLADLTSKSAVQSPAWRNYGRAARFLGAPQPHPMEDPYTILKRHQRQNQHIIP